MRPTHLELIQGLQASLLTDVLPELKTTYAQWQAQIALLVLGVLAQEWDGAVQDLLEENRGMRELFRRAAPALERLGRDPGGPLAGLAQELEAQAQGTDGEPFTISALAARNSDLRGSLARFLVACEDAAEQPGHESLLPLRDEAYALLRRQASKRWDLFRPGATG